VGAYGDRVYRLAIRITGNASDAEEVAQDALWAASRKIDTFRGTSAFGSWLYRITANAAYQKLRKTGSQRHEVSWEDLVPSLDDFGQHGEVAIDWSRRLKDPAVEGELKRVLGRAIDELPARYRTAFLLHDVDGLSNPEIAQTLQVKLAAIKSRVHRARLFLRRRLAGYVGAPRCGDEAVTTAATPSQSVLYADTCSGILSPFTRESDGLRRTSQQAGEARDRAGRAVQRDDEERRLRMPLAKIHVLEGRYTEARLGKVSDAIQHGLMSSLGIPPDDFFQIIHVLPPRQFLHTRSFLGLHYSDDLILLEITFISGRPKEKRLGLLKALNDGVVAAAGISPDDLVITLYETPGENISFGRGLAQRAHISEKDSRVAS